AAGNRYHHERVEHHRHKCCDHQVDHYTREMTLNEPPPPRWCRRGGRRPIYWPHIHFHHLFSTFHHLFSTVCCATKRPSSFVRLIGFSWAMSGVASSVAKSARLRLRMMSSLTPR